MLWRAEKSKVTIDQKVDYNKELNLEEWERIRCGGRREQMHGEKMEREQWRQQEAYIKVEHIASN